MKKVFSFLLTLVMCVSIMPSITSASSEAGSVCEEYDPKTGYCDLTSDEVSKGEASLYADVMERMLLSGDYQVSILYDSEDAPSYVLGTNRNGYIILKRYTTVICECGEKNPYEDSMDIKKYYGGALSYYIDARDYSDKTGTKIDYEYVDILKNAGSDNIKVVVFNEGTDENDVPTRFEICVLGDSYSYIRRRAFGYNDDNTCSAVACGIALNYIKHKFNINVVSDAQTSEYYNKGRATSAAYVASNYPKANSLHRSLVENYGMGAVSYALGIVDPLKNYLKDMVPDSSLRPTISWTYFPKFSTIKSNLLQSKPVLITTTFAGDYSWHTMVVYGFKVDDENDLLLVHTGWYSSQYNSPVSPNSSSYYQNQVWINKSYATLGYYFSIPNN